MDYASLAAELADDPLGRGYAGMTDAQAVTSLNTANRSVPLAGIPPSTFMRGLVLTEWDALTASQRQYLTALLADGDIDVRQGSEIRTSLLSLFAANSGTRTKLLEMLDQQISRATELGLGPVTLRDVRKARGTWS